MVDLSTYCECTVYVHDKYSVQIHLNPISTRTMLYTLEKFISDKGEIATLELNNNIPPDFQKTIKEMSVEEKLNYPHLYLPNAVYPPLFLLNGTVTVKL